MGIKNGNKMLNQPNTIQPSQQQLLHTSGSEWKRNGKKNAHHGTSEKDSFVASP
jgi:hypothetical protein